MERETIQRSGDSLPEILPESSVLRGYAAVFDGMASIVDKGPNGKLRRYTERIARTAFDKSLHGGRDFIATFNHNEDALLGRTSSGTLKLGVDEKGLWYEVSPPDTVSGNNVKALAARKDLRGSSFVADIVRDSWSGNVRTLVELDLVELGPVTRAAYPGTSAELVTAVRSLASYRRRLRIREFALHNGSR